jgi:hypothetical protein
MPSTVLFAPCHILAENLILALKESNGLEFVPLSVRLALIQELSKPCEDIK